VLTVSSWLVFVVMIHDVVFVCADILLNESLFVCCRSLRGEQEEQVCSVYTYCVHAQSNVFAPSH
jgi:hypothetical protein